MARQGGSAGEGQSIRIPMTLLDPSSAPHLANVVLIKAAASLSLVSPCQKGPPCRYRASMKVKQTSVLGCFVSVTFP